METFDLGFTQRRPGCIDGDGFPVAEARRAIQWPYGLGYFVMDHGMIWAIDINGHTLMDCLKIDGL